MGKQAETGSYELQEVEVRLKLQEGRTLYSTERMDTPEAAAKAMAGLLAEMDREYVCIVNMDSKMRPLNYNVVSIGTINQSPVSMQNVFKSAILGNAACLMAFHNHPSGDSRPSAKDIDVTMKMVKAGELMDIQLMDHIIVSGGTGGQYSFRENMPYLFTEYAHLQENEGKNAADAIGATHDAHTVEDLQHRGGMLDAYAKAFLSEKEKKVREDGGMFRYAGHAMDPANAESLENQELAEAERLADSLDTFMYDYDPDGYRQTITDRKMQRQNMAADIQSGSYGYLNEFLVDVVGNSDDAEKVIEAAELLIRLSEYKPLAKVEELEENNINQIDNILSNTVPKQEKQKEVKQKSTEKRTRERKKRPSLRARLAAKKAAVSAGNRQHERAQEMGRSSAESMF